MRVRVYVDGFNLYYRGLRRTPHKWLDLHALVISQDTDLLEPLRMARDEAGKIVGAMWLESTAPGRRHKAATSFIRHADRAMLGRCQFPDPVVGKGGALIAKPAGW